MGAAYLAGLAEGVWGGLDEVAGQWQLDAALRARPGSQPPPTPPTSSGSGRSCGARRGRS